MLKAQQETKQGDMVGDTVCLFSNETKDDGIDPKQIEIIKFQKKFLKEYVLAFICAKS